jgi:ketosteroid isomerase-like protein
MDEVGREILAMEKAALDRWIAGDNALSAHLGSLSAQINEMLKQRGKSRMDRHEMLNPAVDAAGDMAVLSYDWACYVDSDVSRSRATSVYRRSGRGWRIIHTHWAVVMPPAVPSGAGDRRV